MTQPVNENHSYKPENKQKVLFPTQNSKNFDPRHYYVISTIDLPKRQ